ncbi:DUF5693 family protein [Candidatus Acetothermia bacterium]|nr:DUF5693 family protein [Candidatus Acetothermia bacterium]MCI2432283.1 DUF5693 family protein [Candidatus Acetothermia bacterium]MCI2437408.1 DUF5693 family protein [Candidatus Acetothermia bacterium]
MRGKIALRVFLVGLIALALAASLWVGYRRALWESAYKKVTIAVPYQELVQIVYDEGDRLWRERLERLRALGVSALTLELSGFPDWNLNIVQIDRQLLRTLAQAKALGFEIGFVAEIDDEEIEEIAERVQAFINALGAEPSWLMLVDLPPLSNIRSLQRVSQPPAWGLLEFAEPPMSYKLNPEKVVRAHALKSKELERLGFSGALDRWERAVQERNIRLLWVTEHERFARYLERLGARLRDLGFRPGVSLSSLSLEGSESPSALYLVIALGFTALVLLFIQELWSVQTWNRLLVWGGFLWGGWAVLGFWDLSWACEGLALGIALVAPWVLIILLKERLTGWKFLIAVSLGSVGASLAIAALLSDPAYFLKLQEFRGVKVALVAPMLLVVATELWLRRDERWFASRSAWVATAAGASLLFLILERSGNLPLIPVARWEEFLRERLENLFIARPRFKEFLIGHPALVLWDSKNPSRLVALALLAFGALGQASIINTFAHLHTPLWLSLWRTLNGLILGLLVGLAVSVILRILRIGQQWRRRSS